MIINSACGKCRKLGDYWGNKHGGFWMFLSIILKNRKIKLFMDDLLVTDNLNTEDNVLYDWIESLLS